MSKCISNKDVVAVKKGAMSIVMSKSDRMIFYGLFSSKEVVVKVLREHLDVSNIYIIDEDCFEGLDDDCLWLEFGWQAIVPLEEDEVVETDENGFVVNIDAERIWGYMITSYVDR